LDEDGRLYHTGLLRKDVGKIALLPGDPDRVTKIARSLRKPRTLNEHREFKSVGGYVGRDYVVAVSTGIGGPSTAICVEELARLGVRMMIRVGTCGAIDRGSRIGSVIIADAAIRMEGTSYQYAPLGYPASSSPEVALALRDSAESLKKRFELGLVASTDSFYPGQGRKSYGGYYPKSIVASMDELRGMKVLAFEMESATLFTLARIFGIKAGCVLGVVANRQTDEFKPGAGEEAAIEVAIESVPRLGKLTSAQATRA
jgi:uridine phosphorylase